MPIYCYICQRCSHSENCVTGVDDHQVKCSHCGQSMRRTMGMSKLFDHYKSSLHQDEQPIY